METRPEAGRFGRKLDGSGKIRLFAIANPIFQSLLRPLHDWVMSLLFHLKTDGTYDQLGPLRRLQGKKDLYSFDLKAATDLLPVDISGSLLVSLFGDDLAQSWVMMMSMVGFRTPDKLPSRLKARVYRFTRGQPLGYYSSWPVFALTHHVLVWLAAYRVYPGKRFYDYALLGDDIVIADKEVALAYKDIMNDAMAVISYDKSLVSHSGACEFAKRFYANYHQRDWVDLSPVSLACIRLCSGFVSSFVFKQLGVSAINSFRLKGAGYRVFSKVRMDSQPIFDCLSRRWKRHWLTLYAGSGIYPLPLKLWLAFPDLGCLNCYQVGMVRARLLELVRPKDLDENSFLKLYKFWEPDGHALIETLLHPVVKQHLEYVSWYARQEVELSDLTEDLLHPPVSPRRICRESDESLIRRFGRLFKLWDHLRCVAPPGAITQLSDSRFKQSIEIRLFRYRRSVGLVNGETVIYL